jgi:hypothetical protein
LQRKPRRTPAEIRRFLPAHRQHEEVVALLRLFSRKDHRQIRPLLRAASKYLEEIAVFAMDPMLAGARADPAWSAISS